MQYVYAACREGDGWPQTAAGCIYAIPCPEDYQGMVMSSCYAHVLMVAIMFINSTDPFMQVMSLDVVERTGYGKMQTIQPVKILHS